MAIEYSRPILIFEDESFKICMLLYLPQKKSLVNQKETFWKLFLDSRKFKKLPQQNIFRQAKNCCEQRGKFSAL